MSLLSTLIRKAAVSGYKRDINNYISFLNSLNVTRRSEIFINSVWARAILEIEGNIYSDKNENGKINPELSAYPIRLKSIEDYIRFLNKNQYGNKAIPLKIWTNSIISIMRPEIAVQAISMWDILMETKSEWEKLIQFCYNEDISLGISEDFVNETKKHAQAILDTLPPKQITQNKKNDLNVKQTNTVEKIQNQLDGLFVEMNNEKLKSKSLIEEKNWHLIINHTEEIFNEIVESAQHSLKQFTEFKIFKKINQNRLFNEILIWKLWMIDKVYSEDKEKNYISSLITVFGRGCNYEGDALNSFKKTVAHRFISYNNSWQENAGGLQFIFATQIIKNITGDEVIIPDAFTMTELIATTLIFMKHQYIAKNGIIENLKKL